MFKSVKSICIELFQLAKTFKGNPVTLFKGFIKIMNFERLKLLFFVKLGFKVVAIILLLKLIR